jgi:hypothetical protein
VGEGPRESLWLGAVAKGSYRVLSAVPSNREAGATLYIGSTLKMEGKKIENREDPWSSLSTEHSFNSIYI